MMRMLHPARLLRYMIYLAVLGTVSVTLYTLSGLLSDKVDSNSRAKTQSVPSSLRHIDDLLSYIGAHLSINYRLLDHLDYRSRAKVTLTNTGQREIRPGNWSLFVFYMSPIDTDLFNYGNNPEPYFRIYRVQGNLYRLTPTHYFKTVEPGGQVQFEWVSGSWILLYTDVLPNWYVAHPQLPSHILNNTKDIPGGVPAFIEPFPAHAMVRVDGDPYPPFTPEKRFVKNKVYLEGDLRLSIVPTPLLIEIIENNGLGDDTIVIAKDWVVVALDDLAFEAEYLKDKLGISQSTKRPTSRYIQMTIGDLSLDPAYKQHNQGYSISVDKDEEVITIVAQRPAGAFYAVQTILSLYDVDKRSLPVVRVLDAPRFTYRGIMIDLARNFHSGKVEIQRVLEALGRYKMNKLHLHLGDDEGWRLEIPGLPELTQVGAHRCHDLSEQTCILPALGSGPHTNSSGSGFLTTEDYRSILRYARQRHIEVIPEFDMPGHGRAAIKSMEARYKRLKAAGRDEAAREFLISDPDDQSMYMSGQFFMDNAINPCMESTYHFVEHVMEQVSMMHKDILPLSRFHFGGDEVPENAFMESPACQSYMRSHPELLDTKDLKIHFIRRISALAARHSLGVQGWEDAFYGKEVLPMSLHDLYAQNNVVTNVWWNMWEAGIGHRANELANYDYNVVISHSTHLYFDHVQEPDPEERGLCWSIRFIDARRVFGFVPDDIYENIDQRGMGEPWSKEEACGATVNCVPLNKPQNVIGLQGSMWAETVRTRSHQNAMLFPRVLALAERAWHRADWERAGGGSREARRAARSKDWGRFAHLLGRKELRRLDEMDLHYRLPPPGVIKSGSSYEVNTEFPGVVVQYSTDQGRTWRDWDSAKPPRGDVLLASRSFDHKRHSRTIKMHL